MEECCNLKLSLEIGRSMAATRWGKKPPIWWRFQAGKSWEAPLGCQVWSGGELINVTVRGTNHPYLYFRWFFQCFCPPCPPKKLSFLTSKRKEKNLASFEAPLVHNSAMFVSEWPIHQWWSVDLLERVDTKCASQNFWDRYALCLYLVSSWTQSYGPLILSLLHSTSADTQNILTE